MTDAVRIGVIGLGNMGGPMARNLIAAGHAIAGFDVVASALDRAVGDGVAAAASVAEAAVVGYPHDIKGQGIYCFVTLNTGVEPNDDLRGALVQQVRTQIGSFARPDFIQFAPGLPKTRSGKIMRRILRKIAENAYNQLGDTSTLADPTVVANLIENRQNR